MMELVDMLDLGSNAFNDVRVRVSLSVQITYYFFNIKKTLKMKDSVFFAKDNDKGLTETSSAHLCAVAAQVKAHYEETLNNVNFVNSYMDVIGAASLLKQTGIGMTSLDAIDEAIDVICKMNSFISWFAEGRNAIEAERHYINSMNINKWVADFNKTKPELPAKVEHGSEPTMDDMIASLSIGDRQKYLTLEAKAAVYGQFIHKGKPMDVARKAMFNAVSVPYSTIGTGSETIIKHVEPSIETNIVDAEFNKLQFEYRNIEKELNQMKAMLRDKLNKAKNEYYTNKELDNAAFEAELSKYNSDMMQLRDDMAAWQNAALTELSKVRIVLPHNLEDTYQYLSNLK